MGDETGSLAVPALRGPKLLRCVCVCVRVCSQTHWLQVTFGEVTNMKDINASKRPAVGQPHQGTVTWGIPLPPCGLPEPAHTGLMSLRTCALTCPPERVGAPRGMAAMSG